MSCLIDSFRTLFVNCYPKVLISQNIMWLVAMYIKNPTLVDVAWGVNHFLVGYSLYSLAGVPKSSFGGTLAFFLLGLWFVRLSGFLLYNRILKPYVDPRYEILAQRNQNTSKTLYYFFQFNLQAVLTMITATPLYFVFTNSLFRSYNYLGAGLCLVGVLGEAIADNQLQNYKNRRDSSEGVFREGLFKNARHPNLFFELVFWFGMGLIGFNHANFCTIFALFGPTMLWAIMNYLTIPLTTKHMLKSKKDYQKVIEETNKFWPL